METLSIRGTNESLMRVVNLPRCTIHISTTNSVTDRDLHISAHHPWVVIVRDQFVADIDNSQRSGGHRRIDLG